MSIDNLLRCGFYTTMAALDDMAQRHGICNITYFASSDDDSRDDSSDYSTSSSSFWNKPGILGKLSEIAKRSGYMSTCLPCRCTSFRVCHDDPRAEFVLSMLRVTVGKFTRLRIRTNMGSDLEHDYFLMTFGIQCEGLIQNAKRKDTEVHRKYIESRRQIEKEDSENKQQQQIEAIIGQKEGAKRSSSSGGIILLPYPAANDVLIGRGTPYNTFLGNLRWNELIHSNMNRYTASDNFGKTCISMDMVKTVKEEWNGRFLQRTSDGWKILDDVVARKKAASSFRTRMLRPPVRLPPMSGEAENNENNESTVLSHRHNYPSVDGTLIPDRDAAKRRRIALGMQ